ncbi:MAG: pyridoxal phosphate-dependent decarboxylase family protein, partial [Longimicrobiaceae bacterium]
MQTTAADLSAIRARLAELERASATLEPDAKAREELRRPVVRYAEDFLERVDDAPAYRETEDAGRRVLELEIREEGRPLDELLDVVESDVDGTGLSPASGGHLGYIPGGGLYPSSLGDYLADVTNRYSGLFFPSPGAVRMENQLVRWMAEIIGYPEESRGDLTSGGSIASLTGIVTAREARGVHAREVERSAVYLTEQVHHCVAKALRIAGLGDAPIRTVPMDARYRMDAAELARLMGADRAAGIRPFLVVASAGTTDTGSVDPLGQIADVAAEHGAWLHVDAAYGGFFVLTDEVGDLLADLSRADSVVLDPHKGMFLPYGSGAVLVRDGAALQAAHYYRASYLRDVPEEQDWFSPADHSPELTRPFRGLRMWLPLQLFGVAPFRAALAEKLWLARYFHERVQEIGGMEVGPEPALSVALFRWVPPGGDDAVGGGGGEGRALPPPPPPPKP